MSSRLLKSLVLAIAAVVVAIVAGAANGRSAANIYTVHPLVSDSSATPAAATDAALVNGWGLSAGPTTPWWAANNGSNTSTLYSGTGVKAALTVTVAGAPTGTVFNGNAADFVVSGQREERRSTLPVLDRGGDGPRLDAGRERHRCRRRRGPVECRCGLQGTRSRFDRLYATDFHNGRVDVFDASFKLITTTGGFKDAKVAKGFAPFGIQALGGNIFVTYAKQDAAKKDDVAVPGQAYVDEFTTDGQLVASVVNSGKKNAPLNAPWGLALAPADFSVFGGYLLVGNFGNGRISAYTQRGTKWLYKGQLRVASGAPIAIDGLWAIAFGNGAAAGPTNTLYFLSGPSGEKHGLYGSITAG